MENKMILSLSPHIHSSWSVKRCMWQVVIALIPALAVAVWVFGLDALWVIVLSTASCHMGRTPEIKHKVFRSKYADEKPVELDVELFTWEKEDYVDTLRKEFGLD